MVDGKIVTKKKGMLFTGGLLITLQSVRQVMLACCDLFRFAESNKMYTELRHEGKDYHFDSWSDGSSAGRAWHERRTPISSSSGSASGAAELHRRQRRWRHSKGQGSRVVASRAKGVDKGKCA